MPGTPEARPLPPGAGAYTPPPPPSAPAIPQNPAYAAPPSVNGFAVASLVLGILGLCTYGVAGLLALVFGIVALNQVKTRHETGQGLAVAGIILGAVSLAFGVLFFMLFMAPWWLL